MIPKLNKPVGSLDSIAKPNFTIPKLSTPKQSDSTPKFTIPRLQKKTISNKNTDSDYNSLSELVESHLSLLKRNGVSVPNNDKPSEMTTLTQSVSKLTLPENENLNRGRFVIDLTAALTAVKSKPAVVTKKDKKQEVEKPFEIPFIDCEIEVSQPVDMLECRLDISDVVFRKSNSFKGVSKFGKALCRRYRMTKPYKVNFKNNLVNDSKMFNFSTPSPDDVISSYIKKI